MAILEIAKIQVRRGLETISGLPQLSSGEFGWAIDTQRLYIGNGSLEEGAPVVGNTEILTNHTAASIFDFPSYYYTGHTIVGVSGALERTIPDKLNDFVSVFDFDVRNDGQTVSTGTNNTNTLQYAINQIFKDPATQSSPSSRVSLYIPAGIYDVYDTIFIPPNTNLIGDGKDKTIIRMNNSDTSPYPLFQLCGKNGEVWTLFDPVPNAGEEPKNVNLTGLTFEYNSDVALDPNDVSALLMVDFATNVSIKDCKFKGTYDFGSTSSNNYCGIEIRGRGATTTKNLYIDNCSFTNLYYGIKSNYDFQDAFITNSKFENLNRGIVYVEDIALNNIIGPARSRIQNNKFDLIEREGIYVGKPSVISSNYTGTYHISAFNTFGTVGNGSTGTNIIGNGSPKYPVIRFDTPHNLSEGDYFSRFEFINVNQGVDTNEIFIEPVNGNNFLDDKKTYQTLIDGNENQVFLFPYTGYNQIIKIPYKASWADQAISRTGEIVLNISTATAEPTAMLTEIYSYVGNNDGNLTFTSNIDTATNIVSLTAIANPTGNLIYRYNVLQ